MRIALARGSSAAPITPSARTPAYARATPNAPPRSDSTTLSVTSCRSRRPRPAPSAERTASSDCRADARASSSEAMFTHVIRSTKATAPISTSSGRRTSPSSASRTGITVTSVQSRSSTSRSAIRRTMPVISLRAWSMLTPGARRPTTSRKRLQRPRPMPSSGIVDSGIQKSRRSAGKVKSGGMTPSTVNGWPSIVSARPTIEGSLPKRRCQRPWLITMKRSLPTTASSSRSVRPIAAGVASAGKKPGVTYAPSRRSGVPMPVRFAPLPPGWYQ